TECVVDRPSRYAGIADCDRLTTDRQRVRCTHSEAAILVFRADEDRKTSDLTWSAGEHAGTGQCQSRRQRAARCEQDRPDAAARRERLTECAVDRSGRYGRTGDAD